MNPLYRPLAKDTQLTRFWSRGHYFEEFDARDWPGVNRRLDLLLSLNNSTISPHEETNTLGVMAYLGAF